MFKNFVKVTIFLLIGFNVGLVDNTFGYNMTDNDLIEGRILVACIELQITSSECSMIYGGIYTGNGEPIK